MTPLDFALQLHHRVREIRDVDLVGTYLHGSAALGGFTEGVSDVDVLFVTARPLTPEQKSRVSETIQAESAAFPDVDLETSVITAEGARSHGARLGFELHVATGPDYFRLVDGGDGRQDPDLILHMAVCGSRGIPIGDSVDPALVFAPVPRNDVVEQLRAELRWAIGNAPGRYVVLNACRALHFVENGSLISKIGGGVWAHQRLPQHAQLIERALAAQRNLSTGQMSAAVVGAFVNAILEMMDGATLPLVPPTKGS